MKIYKDINELSSTDVRLIDEAKNALNFSYSPYSNFKVGAVALLDDGRIIMGSNQENSSFGVTMCAERVLLANYSTLAQKNKIVAIAVTYKSKGNLDNMPITPCGICRQVLSEVEMVHGSSIRIILFGQSGEIWEFDNASSMLPLVFNNSFFK